MTRRQLVECVNRRGKLIRYYKKRLRQQFNAIANNHPLSEIRRN